MYESSKFNCHINNNGSLLMCKCSNTRQKFKSIETARSKMLMLLTRLKLLLFIDYGSCNLNTVAYYLNYNLQYNIDSLKMN